MRAIVFAALTLAACAEPSGPVDAKPAPEASQTAPSLAAQIRADMARLDRELRGQGVRAARIGETADLGGGLSVRPLAVIEDSRCPSDVTCIWAGRVRLRANVSGEDVELTLGEPLATAHGSVVLSVVSPGSWAHWPASEVGERPPYRFGFMRG